MRRLKGLRPFPQAFFSVPDDRGFDYGHQVRHPLLVLALLAGSGCYKADDSITVPSIIVSPTSGLASEAGETAAFTVRLATAPAADVTIALSSSNTDEGTVSPASLTFTPLNWNLPQTVTVTGVDDPLPVADGDTAYTIVTAPADSLDGNYSGLDADDVSVTNLDDDTAAVVVTAAPGLQTTEAGGSATFTVALSSVPSETVTIALSSSDPSEGTVSPAALTFAADATALEPQTVTVTGVDDGIADGNVAYLILTAAAVSADPNYDGRDAGDVSVTNTDNEGISPWTKHGSNPVLTVGAAWDSAYVTEPSVLKLAADSYVMWFEGRNKTGAKHEQIGRATATDGIAWTKDAGNPVFSHSSVSDTFDENGVGAPSVLPDGPGYRLWYAGTRKLNQPVDKIGLAASPDGIAWTRDPANPVLVGGAAGSWEASEAGSPHVLHDGTNYRIWYSGRGPDGIFQIGTATSPDGISWTKSSSNPVLGRGAAGEFDAGGVMAPCVILDAGVYRMWYTGLDAGGTRRIGYASSPDGVTWTKLPANPVLVPGTAGSWDAAGVMAPCVIKDGTELKMWYVGQNAQGTLQIGYATNPGP